jgi:hypothetical protein
MSTKSILYEGNFAAFRYIIAQDFIQALDAVGIVHQSMSLDTQVESHIINIYFDRITHKYILEVTLRFCSHVNLLATSEYVSVILEPFIILRLTFIPTTVSLLSLLPAPA